MKLKQLQEKELIAAIKKDFSPHANDLILGIGDDAAVIPGENRKWIITKDLLIEDFHFLAASHPPALLGKKSLNVNISDIAAMGCDPRFALLGLGLPFLIIGATFDSIRPLLRRIHRYSQLIQIVGGLLLIIVGILILTNNLVWFSSLAA